jgi:hypothetical protein
MSKRFLMMEPIGNAINPITKAPIYGDPISIATSVGGAVASNVVGGMFAPDSPSGGASGGGNTANGSIYDPFQQYRAQAGSTLNSLIYGGSAGAANANSQASQLEAQANSIQPYHGEGWPRFAARKNGLLQQAADLRTQGAKMAQQNPTDIIKQMPGYQFGMDQGRDQLNRTMAQTGQSQSGAQQVALSQYGEQYAGSYYDKMIAQLNGMAGVNQSMTDMTGANNAAQNQSNLRNSTLNQNAQGLIGAGVSGLQSIFNNSGYVPSNGGSSSVPGTTGVSMFTSR